MQHGGNRRGGKKMNEISSATVILSLEKFDELRKLADEREAEQLKNRIASCISADFELFKEELKKIDKSLLDTTNEEIECVIANAIKKIEFTIDKKAAISLFIDYVSFRKNGAYEVLNELGEDNLKKNKIKFK